MSENVDPVAGDAPAGTEPVAEPEINDDTNAESAPALSTEEVHAKVSRLVAEGKKAIALKQWEEGVAKYGDALEAQGQIVDDFDPSMAPLLLSYGKALYELVLSQQGVMGKEEVAKSTNPVAGDAAPTDKPNFVFEGDGDDDEEEGEEEGEGGEGEGGEGGEGEGEAGADEPEDDFNAAWDVLDVARTIYLREIESGKLSETELVEKKLLLADCYLTLGDVSLETENFPQAVTDYTSALEIKEAHLPASSRALASAHYQLGTVLEFTPAGRAAALKHVQSALDGFKLRAKEIEAADGGRNEDVKSEDVKKMTAKEREVEKRDVETLIGDLEVKIEELNAAPPAADFVAESINHLLGGAPGSAPAAASDAPVNDLTSMVRKKKKPAAAPVPKRGPEEDAGGAEKKARTE